MSVEKPTLYKEDWTKQDRNKGWKNRNAQDQFSPIQIREREARHKQERRENNGTIRRTVLKKVLKSQLIIT